MFALQYMHMNQWYATILETNHSLYMYKPVVNKIYYELQPTIPYVVCTIDDVC